MEVVVKTLCRIEKWKDGWEYKEWNFEIPHRIKKAFVQHSKRIGKDLTKMTLEDLKNVSFREWLDLKWVGIQTADEIVSWIAAKVEIDKVNTEDL